MSTPYTGFLYFYTVPKVELIGIQTSVNALNGLSLFLLPYAAVGLIWKDYGCVNALNGLSLFLLSELQRIYR